MRTLTRLLLSVCLLVPLLIAALNHSTTATAAPTDPNTCSLATLKGTYTYFGQGARGTNGQADSYPYLEVGIESYNGAGGVTNLYNDSESVGATRDTATYTLGTNCQGVVTYASGASYAIFVDPKGESFTFLQTSPTNQVYSGENRRVSTDTSPRCSNATLRGTYRYTGQGFVGDLRMWQPYLESGIDTFDGVGKVANMYTDSTARVTARDTATYQVNTDCTGVVTYAHGGAFHIFVDPSGNGFVYVQEAKRDKIFSGEEKRISSDIIDL